MYESYDENRARLQIPSIDRAELLGAFTVVSEQDATATQQALHAAQARADQFITSHASAEQQIEQ